MHIVFVGHVDHGKSTVIGRLLAETGSLPESKLAQVRATCERMSKPFEYAFLLDALKDEQAQGITIDAARVFFESAKRPYLIIDAPGHIEFLKNMVTGASHAEAAVLVIDAKEGIQENSRRHGYMLAALGIKQIGVLVNKMDLVGYDQSAFETIERDYTAFLKQLGVVPAVFIPVSAMQGDNIATRAAERMPWYQGPSVLEALDGFEEAPAPEDQPFRMPVQDVYKFTRGGDARRIVAGTVESGALSVGDEVVFYPSGKRSRVRTIEAFAQPSTEFTSVGEATGFTLDEQLYVTRGELAVRADQPRPEVSTRLRVSIFWLGAEPLAEHKDYVIKLGTARVPMRVESIEHVIDASTLAKREDKTSVQRHDVAECVLRLRRPLACDPGAAIEGTGRFVIVDDYDIRGGGIVIEAQADAQHELREKVFLRNNRWEKSLVDSAQRAERYNQRSTLVLVTGPREGRRKEVAKALERRLFDEGKLVYYLGFGSVLYGVQGEHGDSSEASHDDLMHRLGEVAHIILDAGIILIVTAQELAPRDIAIFRAVVQTDRIETVWVGDRTAMQISPDLEIDDHADDEAVQMIRQRLQECGAIFRAW
ncbi:MAG: GTP-binding protein [Planctomycetota bacterium]|nr:GTP-binding protein [Planctomycetota bacterium]